MKKPSLGSGGIKALFTNHVEKMVLGVSLLVMLVFVYLGFSLESYNKLPADIKQVAEQAKQNVERDSWENVASEPERLVTVNYTSAVQEGSVPTRGALYSYEMPLKVPLVRPLVKRGDPELYAPVKLVVRSMNAPIALNNESRQVDKLAELESVPPLEPPKERPRREQRQRGGGRGMNMPPSGMDGDYGGDMSAGMAAAMGAMGGMQGMEGTGTEPARLLQNPDGWRPGGMGGMGAMGGMGGMGAMASMGSMMPGMEDMDEDDPYGGTMGSGVGGNLSDRYIPAPRQIISVMALIPYEKQLDEYKRRFESAAGYQPMRDQPNYLSFTVERAEVSDDPNAPLNWGRVGSAKTALDESKKWAGIPNEVADPSYTLPLTTMPIPPILLRDYDRLVTHPDVPKRTRAPATPQTRPRRDQMEEEAPSDSDLPTDIPRGQFGAAMGSGMGGMDPSMAMGGMGGMDPSMAMGGMGGMGGMDPSMAMGGMGGMDPSMAMGGMGGMGGMDPSMAMGGMGGMDPGMGMSMGRRQPVTEWKLVRFFDFDARPGKQYRYRIQLLVEDPNYPKDASFEVNPRTLDDATAARLAQLKERESEGGSRQYFHRTAWSEPSDPISTEPFERFYAGDVKSRALMATHKNGAEVANRPLAAKIAGVVWDPSWVADVSRGSQVIQGSVLNYQGSVEIVHPISLIFKKLDRYNFRTGAVVADLRGGAQVGGDSMEPILAPAEFAVVDAQGNLVIRHEFDDIDRYRRYAFVEDEAPPAAAAGDPTTMGGMMAPPTGAEMRGGGRARGRRDR